ncbi:hypothetical protein CLV52_1028 [Amnibacterium kyonggiense]|uniref:Uncharacterized protein n=1 Tax=Amnibacterium kyonggiense TaxID=595671 RepID=A0A4R7FRN6_9MICO|nr:hypothetical protein CLV52_1028 [Amnibacterium kyonggiense]
MKRLIVRLLIVAAGFVLVHRMRDAQEHAFA